MPPRRPVYIFVLICITQSPIWAQKLETQRTPAPVQAAPIAKKPSREAIKAANLFEQAVKLQHAGKDDGAIRMYRQLIQIAPGAYPAYVNIGLILQRKKDLSGAEAAYRKAIQIEPKQPVPWIQLAELYLDSRRMPEAKTAAEKAVALAP